MYPKVKRVLSGTMSTMGLVLLGMVSPPPAFSHHSLALFDRVNRITIEGTVKTFEWTNPHCRLWVIVKDDAGADKLWGLEGSAITMLGRAGWSRNSIKVGDKVKVTFSPLKDGRPGGFFNTVEFADGHILTFQAPPGVDTE
ncbi:MAG: DUF6152 family protein [Steroidobacteraceae bacterium]